MRTLTAQLAALVFLAAAFSLAAQTAPIAPKSAAQGKPSTKEQSKADTNKSAAERGDVVDQLVAIVNNDIILESDVDEEMRFSRLYPYQVTSGDTARDQAITRLIDRDLVLQQERGVQPEIPNPAVEQDEADLRRDLPACAAADCASDPGWQKFLASGGFTESELRDRLRQRAEVLRFIEQRFRSGIQVSDRQVQDFYTGTMLPQYRKEQATPPALNVLAPRIEELLLQQQVSKLLDQWLKTLREAGSVRIFKAGEEAP